MMATERYLVLDNAIIAPLASAAELIHDGAIALAGKKIAWVGTSADLPSTFSAAHRVNMDGRLITPALIDCHTHLVYGGDRADEFEMRLNGASYTDIAAAGGGILSTVRATRATSERDLIAAAVNRVDNLLSEGVATIEIKSGYGLDLDSELKMLRAARALASARRVRIKTTFLGAHALPAEFAGHADDYIDFVCQEVMPMVRQENLADAVDAYCETIAFSPAQTARIFTQAKRLGFAIKLHAEQFSNLGGAALAASYGALSTDHLEHLDDKGVHALATANTVAVLLPGAFYMLNEKQKPPIDALRHAGVVMAVATDSNPGTSPMTSLLTAMNMSCVLFGLTPQEALRGCTCNAARALGLGNDTGDLTAGKSADLAVWDVETPAQLVYYLGANPLHMRFFDGSADGDDHD